MMHYKQEIQYVTDDRSMTIEDLRTGETIEVSLKAFKLNPASSKFKERFLIVERKGYLISIPIILVPAMEGYIASAKDRLEEAMRILDTKSDLRSARAHVWDEETKRWKREEAEE